MLITAVFGWLLASFPTLASSPSPAPLVAGHDCAEASRARLETTYQFDAVRVTTAPGAAGASVQVSVATGDRFTSLRAPEGGVSTVALDDRNAGQGSITLAIEPDLDASVGACVESVEFLRDGAVVGSVALRPAKP